MTDVLDAVRQGLEAGFVEGRNVETEFRWPARIRPLAGARGRTGRSSRQHGRRYRRRRRCRRKSKDRRHSVVFMGEDPSPWRGAEFQPAGGNLTGVATLSSA